MDEAPPSTPHDPTRLLRLALVATGALAVGVLLVRLSSFGIWDPWELSAAEAGRRSLEGSLESAQRPPLSPWLVGSGFGLLSVREWAGRLPIALSGLFALGVLWAWVRRFAGDRVALYATLVASTSLAVILNSRQMLGQAPVFAAGAVVGLGGMGLLFDEDANGRRRAGWAALVALGSVTGIAAGGALLAVLPPLLASVLAAGLLGKLDPRESATARDPWVLALLGWTVVACVMVGVDIYRDTADYSPFVGGVPLGEAPPTFDRSIEVIFHGFAPWSALLPLAIGACLRLSGPDGRSLRDDAPLRLVALLWAAFALAAHSLFQSRFGTASYPGALALAAMVALWLRDLEKEGVGNWAAGLVTAFFTALIIRDFALYPASPIDALPVGEPEVPEAFNPKQAWAGVLGAFGATAFAATCARPVERGDSLKAPYLWFVRQWREGGLGMRAWFVVAALILLACLGLGATAVLFGRRAGLGSLWVRAGKGALLVPIALPVVISGTQMLAYAVGRLERYRLVPLWLSAVAVAAYASHGFLPALSGHLSPREVFEAYNQHAAEGEPLAEHQVGSRAAAYYATGEVQELGNRNALISYLASDGRRWATFPSEHLAEVDRGFRRRTGKHLVLASDPGARVVLAANQPVDGLTDQNPLADTVVEEAPKVEHPIRIEFEKKIALLGYNLSLPDEGSVGPGQRFTVEWVFEALSSNIGSYEVFVHMDGAGNRIHGDHDPVDGEYPVSLWQKGDIVIDRQTLKVPTNYRPGNYQMMVGFYRGNRRLEVESGPHDGTNRAKVGILKVR